jgi:hypothetical protein
VMWMDKDGWITVDAKSEIKEGIWTFQTYAY